MFMADVHTKSCFGGGKEGGGVGNQIFASLLIKFVIGVLAHF